MDKPKMFVFLLLAVMLIIPMALAVVPAVKAGEEPSVDQADLTHSYTYDGVPALTGWYTMMGRFTYYDWTGNKVEAGRKGYLHFSCQDGHKVTMDWFVESSSTQIVMGSQAESQRIAQIPPPAEQLNLCASPNGYVGSELKDDHNRVKNKPRLSMHWEAGAYGQYPPVEYWTGCLNAQITIDNKTGWPKSIKGNILGWGEVAPSFPGTNDPSRAQFEGKFTAKPLTP